MKIINIYTGELCELPKSWTRELDGAVISTPTVGLMACEGWREWVWDEPPEEGFRVIKWNIVDLDGLTARRTIAEVENIAQAELIKNGERWTLDNRYIGYCDQLRVALGGEPTKTKLGFEELEPMMLTVKAAAPDSYNDLRDAMQAANSALIRFDVRWWDTCVWHPEIES
jgi:hypothetical protein